MRSSITVLTACLLGGVATIAHAQPRPADPIPESPQAARALAEKIFHEAAEAYTAGDYEKAATLWQKSYDLSKEPELFENIGNAYERLGRPKEARDALAKWRDVAPAAERAILDRRIANLDARIAREDAEEQKRQEEADRLRQAEEDAKANEGKGGGRLSIPGVIVASIGGALVITGVVVAAVGAGERPDEAEVCKVTGERNLCATSAKPTIDASNAKTIAGDVLWITGAAAMAVGGVLLIVEATRSPDEAPLPVGFAPLVDLPRAGGATFGATAWGAF